MIEVLKTCCRCGIEKPLDCYHNDKNKPDGKATTCKDCKREYDKWFRKQNRDKLIVHSRRYYLENKETLNKASKENYEKNKEKYLAQCKEYRERNREVIAKRTKEYRERNKESIRLRQKERYKENSEKIRKRVLDYAKQNKDKMNARNAKRRAIKRNATPDWLSDEHLAEISDCYSAAQMFRIYTGQEYHVDHIIPLKHELVCGLHVPWNLQILTAFENLSKHNSFNLEDCNS